MATVIQRQPSTPEGKLHIPETPQADVSLSSDQARRHCADHASQTHRQAENHTLHSTRWSI